MSTRRDFLRQAAGLPVILGLPGCSRVDVPGWLDAALRRLRELDAAGLVFRLPPDPAGRCALGHAITRHLLNSPDPDVHEVLIEAPLLCLDGPVIQDRFRGVRASDTLILVDGDGFAVDGLPFEPGEQWANFVPSARALLDGPGGRRLARKGVPALIQERLTAAPPRRDELRAAIEKHWESIAATQLPYGVETTLQMKGGCGGCGCEESPAGNLPVPCGMAIAVKNSRYFVKFLKK